MGGWGRGSQTHVHNSAVDVAELLKAKEPSAVSRVIEGVGLFSRVYCQLVNCCGGYDDPRRWGVANSDRTDVLWWRKLAQLGSLWQGQAELCGKDIVSFEFETLVPQKFAK